MISWLLGSCSTTETGFSFSRAECFLIPDSRLIVFVDLDRWGEICISSNGINKPNERLIWAAVL